MDLCKSKSTTEILAGLQSAYPFPKNDIDKGCQLLFGALNKDIVNRAKDLLISSDNLDLDNRAKKLGEIMTEAQKNFDEYGTPLCPS